MLILGIMCLGIFIGSRFFPAAQKEKNEALQLFCTLILIFSMGIGLGQWEGFLEELMRLGLQSFLFCLIPTVLSILFVQFLARRFMVCKGRETEACGSRDQAEAVSEAEPKGAPGGTDFMVFFALGALLAGIILGALFPRARFFALLAARSDVILYILMASVGISVGLRRGVFQQIRRYRLRIFIIPAGIVAASIAGGLLGSLLMGFPVHEGISVAGGLGWYSLAGVAIGNLAGARLGSIAFLSNLMRELLAFFLIPLLSRRFGSCACIAPAAATSEDTTLPMLIRYTDEETVILSVFNGIICSAVVPVLIACCYAHLR